MNNGSAICKHHNGGILCTDSTSPHTPFIAAYLQAESGVLDNNKLKEKEALRTVLDVTLRNCGAHHTVSHGLPQQHPKLC